MADVELPRMPKAVTGMVGKYLGPAEGLWADLWVTPVELLSGVALLTVFDWHRSNFAPHIDCGGTIFHAPEIKLRRGVIYDEVNRRLDPRKP